MIRYRIDFRVSGELRDRFASLTGDDNPLHVDAEFARRFRYRRCVVHGMLPFSFLALVAREFPGKEVRFRSLTGRFLGPVFPGDRLRLDIECTEDDSGDLQYKAVWHNRESSAAILQSEGSFQLLPSPEEKETNDVGGGHAAFVAHRGEMNEYAMEDLESAEASLSVLAPREACVQYAQALSEAAEPGRDQGIHAICPNLAITLPLSTLVGIKLPGKYATLLDFVIHFDRDATQGREYQLKSRVDKTNPTTRLVRSVFQIANASRLAHGRVTAALNSPPAPMIGCQEIRNHHMNLGLEGKVVLVTGASRGIGGAAAKFLAVSGAKVMVNYHLGRADAEEIVREIQDAGGSAAAFGCDISDEEAVRAMVREGLSEFGRIDVLVHAAVGSFLPAPVESDRWSDWDSEFQVSIKGLRLCCQALLPQFKTQGAGKIIALSSTAVDTPVIGQSRYVAMKSAMVGYIRSLAIELAPHHIQANLVEPAMTETDLIAHMPRTLIDRMGRDTPYGRNLLPVEVAQAIAFLASDWSNAMTGQRLILNGGQPPFL